MRRTVCRHAVQNILHDVQAAAECRTRIATSSFAQRRTFLMALHDELHRHRDIISRANRRDCDVFGQQQQQRGTPSVTIPPTMPSAAAAAAATAAPPAGSAMVGGGGGGRHLHTPVGGHLDHLHGTHGLAGEGGGSPHRGSAAADRMGGAHPASSAGSGAGGGGGGGSAASPPRRRSSLEYVASTALSCSAAGGDTAAITYSNTATAEALGGGVAGSGSDSHVDGREATSEELLSSVYESAGGEGGSSSGSSGSRDGARSGGEQDTSVGASADPHSGSTALSTRDDASSTTSSYAHHSTYAHGSNNAHAHSSSSSSSHHAFFHTEPSGGGGHLLLTPDHHLLISPLRLDKLHATIDYLLCQPDPIAVPPSCWLHPYAERGSGDVSEFLQRHQHGRYAQALAGFQPPTKTNVNVRSPGSANGSGGSGGSRNNSDVQGGGASGATPSSSAAKSTAVAQEEPYTRYGRCTRLTEQLEVFELPVPLGMVGILSRFRPRISLDAVAMGLFAGNTVLVDGGVSLYYTNIALMTAVRRALTAAGLPASAVVCVESYDTAHRSTSEWLQLSEYVDLAVVCGPPKLFQFASRHSTIPLMRATGQFSSVYVDQSASFEVALEVILNSKFQKLGAANAATTAIIHRDFPRYTELLMALSAGGAVLLGDVAAQERVPDSVLELASEEEYQGLSQYGLRDGTRTLCVKTVDSLAQALFFIESYGSKQSDCVVATDPEVCATYCRQVDTAVALVNASTRLSSGVPLGCGVDFAISTSKAHCRGPLTLNMMTTRKLVARSRSMHHGALR